MSPSGLDGVGFQPNDSDMPRSVYPWAWCTTSVRIHTSSDSPVERSVKTRPLPMSMPVPVSASPPSCRSPTSTLGVSATWPPTLKPREPSSAVRARVTLACEAFSRPAAPSTPEARETQARKCPGW